MAIKTRTEDPIDVVVQSGQNIYLSIIIGNAMIGASILKFTDSNTLYDKGEFNHRLLGKAEDLVGRTLRVITNVLDSNPATNKMIVIRNFVNAAPSPFEYEDQVDEDDDIFSITREYNFKSQAI